MTERVAEREIGHLLAPKIRRRHASIVGHAEEFEPMTLPVEAGEAIDVGCSLQPSPQSVFASIEIVGNYVPA